MRLGGLYLEEKGSEDLELACFGSIALLAGFAVGFPGNVCWRWDWDIRLSKEEGWRRWRQIG